MLRGGYAIGLLAVGLLAGCSNRSSTEPIVIGHIAPLEKPAGAHAKQGILLAVEEVNEGDKVAGQLVAVVHVDSRGDGTVAQAEAVRLVTINKVVGLLVDAGAGRAEKIARELEPYGLPLLTTDVLLAAPSGDCLFAFNLTAAQKGRVLARYTAQHLKPARVAVLTDQRSAASMAFASSFLKESPKDGPTRVEQWTYENPAGIGDLIPRLKKMQPEAMLFAGEVGDLPALRNHLQNADLHGPLLVGEDTFESIPLDARDNVYLATCFAPEAVAEGQDFARKYRERYHEAPGIHAALAYEAIRTMCKALNQTKGAAGPDVRKELAGAESFPGVIGALSFGKDHAVRRPALVLQWKDGQAKVAERYGAE